MKTVFENQERCTLYLPFGLVLSVIRNRFLNQLVFVMDTRPVEVSLRYEMYS